MTDQKHNEAEGIAFTQLYGPNGLKVNVTHRGNSSTEALEELMLTVVHAEKQFGLVPTFKSAGQPTKEVAKFKAKVLTGIQTDEHGHYVEPPLDRNGEQASMPLTSGKDLGLVKYKPKASELKPGDIYEIEVDEYVASEKQIDFWSSTSKYPVLKHNLAIEGLRKTFDEAFKGWDPGDTNSEREPIPGGAVILKVIGSDSLTSAGNPYSNLLGMRRP